MRRGSRIRQGTSRRTLSLAVAVTTLMARPAFAQHRIADALTWADIASGSWTSLRAACDASGPGSGGGAPTTIGDLPAIPGAGPSPSARAWYFAGATGLAALGTDAALREGHWVGVAEGRVHWVPSAFCRLDVSAIADLTTAPTMAGNIEARFFLLPGNAFAPALEVAGGQVFGGGSVPGEIDARFSGRFSAGTPNLYALTLGPVAEYLFKEKAPKLDVRARLFIGVASFAGDHRTPVVGPGTGYQGDAHPGYPVGPAMNGGGHYSEAGGTAAVSVLHIPVSFLVSTEQLHSEFLPADRAPARDAAGIAFRLPGFNRDAWIVARAVRHRDIQTTTDWRVEFTHLLLGAR